MNIKDIFIELSAWKIPRIQELCARNGDRNSQIYIYYKSQQYSEEFHWEVGFQTKSQSRILLARLTEVIAYLPELSRWQSSDSSIKRSYYFFCKLYNTYRIKRTILIMFKVYSSVPLSTSHSSATHSTIPLQNFSPSHTEILYRMDNNPPVSLPTPVTVVLPSMCDFDDSGYQTEAESYCIFVPNWLISLGICLQRSSPHWLQHVVACIRTAFIFKAK